MKLSDENEILIKRRACHGRILSKIKTIPKDNYRQLAYTPVIMGEIDEDGYLKITDRKKSLIKTSGGKYVSPTQIEEMLSRLSYVENVMVIGNERMYITR